MRPPSHQTSGLRTPPRYIRFPALSSIVDRKLLFPSNVQSENDQLAVVLLGSIGQYVETIKIGDGTITECRIASAN